MIEPKYIVEVESTDIITSNSDGFIKRPLLIFNNNFLLDKYSNSISLTTPVFKKFRQDKFDVFMKSDDKLLEENKMLLNEKSMKKNELTREIESLKWKL